MIRGERFELDLGSDDEQSQTPQPAAFVGDVLERKPTAPKPPSAPSLKSKNGFPDHKKRTVASRFKQQKTQNPHEHASQPSAAVKHVTQPASGKSKSWEEEEKERIDQENRQKLANMSTSEIEEERRELMNSLSPALLQRLLLRSNVESGSEESDLSQPSYPATNVEGPKPKAESGKTVKFEEPAAEEAEEEEGEEEDVNPFGGGDEPVHGDTAPPSDPFPSDTVHFPRPVQPPSLDPASESFFTDLHQKYFPSLPSDPDKLEWMQPSSKANDSYDPTASAFNAGDIRFNFKGELIPPKTASEIPVTAGLHHHGDAPDAAGYTIAELAHLARSTYPAQRCISFQTLGRVLYRLSKGEFGNAGEADSVETIDSDDNMRELARGLWHEVERLKVVQILVEESEGKGVDRGRHVSAKAYATEAVWLWRKGGGRRWKAA